MQWGRIWGRGYEEQGFKHYSYWGDGSGYHNGLLDVIKVRGVIKPCMACKKRYSCAMFKSFTRYEMRHGEYSQGTSILHKCGIFEPDHLPQKIQAPNIVRKSSGQDPT